jgi:hypothetical protein
MSVEISYFHHRNHHWWAVADTAIAGLPTSRGKEYHPAFLSVKSWKKLGFIPSSRVHKLRAHTDGDTVFSGGELDTGNPGAQVDTDVEYEILLWGPPSEAKYAYAVVRSGPTVSVLVRDIKEYQAKYKKKVDDYLRHTRSCAKQVRTPHQDC